MSCLDRSLTVLARLYNLRHTLNGVWDRGHECLPGHALCLRHLPWTPTACWPNSWPISVIFCSSSNLYDEQLLVRSVGVLSLSMQRSSTQTRFFYDQNVRANFLQCARRAVDGQCQTLTRTLGDALKSMRLRPLKMRIRALQDETAFGVPLTSPVPWSCICES